MPIAALPDGDIHYRVAGPADSTEPPVVFIHGLLVNGELWSGVAWALAERGIRSFTPDLPLGAHTHPMNADADLSPRGVARTIIAFLEALDLRDVTLIGNDTGGALCQFVIDTDATRVGRLVLTNCDAFDQFPPAPFGLLVKAGSRPGRLKALTGPMRSTRIRHSVLGYGGLVRKPLDPAQTRRWIDPLADPAIRRDTARFMSQIDKRDLLDVSTRLGQFGKPVHLVWGAADRFFKVEFAHRLQNAFGNATLTEIEGGRTFVPLDEPQRVADEVAAIYTRT